MGTPIWPIEGIALESDADAVSGSLAYRVLRMYDDNYSPVSVYPTLAAGAALVSTAANWTLAAAAEIMPAVDAPATDFLLHAVVIESMSKDGVFELVLYYGAGDTECARVRFSQNGGFFGYCVLKTPSVLIPADSRIYGSLACSVGGAGAATATVSIIYRAVA